MLAWWGVADLSARSVLLAGTYSAVGWHHWVPFGTIVGAAVAWMAWRLVTSAFTLRGRYGTW